MKDVVLLADKNSYAWDFANKIKNYIQEQKGEEVQLDEISINHFRNKELDIHVPRNLRKKDVYLIQDSTKNPQEWWVELLLLKDLLLSASAESVTFVLPDMLYSRKDRKDKPHVPISARALARSISPGLKRVITMDLHASQIQGFYPENIPLDNLYSFPAAVHYLNEKKLIQNSEDLVIVSPDAGGVDRVKAFANRLGSKNPIAFIYKRRDKPGQVSEMILVGDVQNKDCFIIDDIIDSGETLCESARLLKKNGAKNLYCYGTHGFFTGGIEELNKHFKIIMTSNTHHRENDDVFIIDVTPVFAEAIYRAQKGLSISELFE